LTGYKRVLILTTAVVLSGLALSGCFGGRKGAVPGVLPDEFRIQARQPLSLPPEYALRPPTLGKPRPQDLQPESAARAALVGQPVTDRGASEGERLLLGHAGVDASMGNIKAVIDDEYGDIAYKSPSFADKVLFWRKDKAETQTPITQVSGSNVAIDPAAEARRIENLTGNKSITIVKTAPPKDKRKSKLPGL
jgi:hypothetical protein